MCGSQDPHIRIPYIHPVCVCVCVCAGAHLNAVAIGTMLVDVAAERVRIEAVLECIEHVAAARALRA